MGNEKMIDPVRLIKNQSTSSSHVNKIQVITPQNRNNTSYAQTPQQRLKGGNLMNKREKFFGMLSRSTTMSRDPKVTTNSITGK